MLHCNNPEEEEMCGAGVVRCGDSASQIGALYHGICAWQELRAKDHPLFAAFSGMYPAGLVRGVSGERTTKV